MPNDHKKRMEEATSIILGTVAIAAFIFLVIWSLGDWGWTADRFMSAVNTWGGYGHEHE